MSISSSMNASVAGLAAQASHLGTISDNIANAQTAGYKRATTDFASMVLVEGNGASYTAGGVRAANVRLVEDRGALSTTTNATDIAITGGRGFLPVTTATDATSGTANPTFMLTTTGSFNPDANGYLRTPTGLVLMGVPVGPDGAAPEFPRSTISALEPIRVSTSHIAGSPTARMEVTANLPANATNGGATAVPETMTVEYYDNMGLPQTLTFTMTPQPPADATAPPSYLWTMQVADSASDPAVVAEYEMRFDDGVAPVLPATGPDYPGGSILDVEAVMGNAYSAEDGTIEIDVAGGPIQIAIGRPGELAGAFQQLGKSFAPMTVSKDGAPAGTLSGMEVDPAGFLVASYSSGETRKLYQIPVVDVPNPNGLSARDNQTFVISRESGPFTLWDAGDGPTGDVVGFAREESTVDVAQELTQLIITQRAYSSNAKVIQTVDEMFQETTNIKR